jgi:hypothetical protein
MLRRDRFDAERPDGEQDREAGDRGEDDSASEQRGTRSDDRAEERSEDCRA